MTSFPMIHRIVGGGLLLLPFLFLASTDTPAGPGSAENRYIGAKACKNCHNGADKGDMFTHWEKTPHAKAFETLGTPKAKEIAAKLKIEDPQKSEQCLKCHVTAFGADKKEIKRGFKQEDGVQCESCHGAGEEHFKTRFKESQGGGEPSAVSAEEITRKRDAAICTTCHNDQSPTYEPFCFKEYMKKIAHWDPRKNRTEEEIKKIESECTKDCPVCSKEKKGD